MKIVDTLYLWFTGNEIRNFKLLQEECLSSAYPNTPDERVGAISLPYIALFVRPGRLKLIGGII